MPQGTFEGVRQGGLVLRLNPLFFSSPLTPLDTGAYFLPVRRHQAADHETKMKNRSPFVAVSLLYQFVQGRMSMTVDTFDTCFDTLTWLLEQANNEKYRLRDPEKE